MTPEEQRVAIAEACGWTATVDDDQFWRATRADGSMTSDLWCSMSSVWNVGIPDYLNDLNAMHEAEKVFTIEQQRHYAEELGRSYDGSFLHVTASADQRAKALLKALDLWKEEA